MQKYIDAHWKEHVHAATFAISAMRDPTEEMLDEGPPPPYMEKHVWAKMIDAALKEQEKVG